METDHGAFFLTISLGVSSVTGDDPDVANLFRRADAALYEAKNAGRNRIAIQ